MICKNVEVSFNIISDWFSQLCLCKSAISLMQFNGANDVNIQYNAWIFVLSNQNYLLIVYIARRQNMNNLSAWITSKVTSSDHIFYRMCHCSVCIQIGKMNNK